MLGNKRRRCMMDPAAVEESGGRWSDLSTDMLDLILKRRFMEKKNPAAVEESGVVRWSDLCTDNLLQSRRFMEKYPSAVEESGVGSDLSTDNLDQILKRRTAALEEYGVQWSDLCTDKLKRRRLMEKNPAAVEESGDGRWSNLCPDILNLILSRIRYPCDRIRFLAVCKQWRCLGLGSKPPWLWSWMLLSPIPNKDPITKNPSIVSFHLPVETRICGSFDGWLFVATANYGCVSCRNSLMNPFSGDKIPLPDDRDMGLIHRAVLSSSPDSSGPVLVAALRAQTGIALCCVQADRSQTSSTWTHILEDPRLPFTDILFHKGLLHAVNTIGGLHTFKVVADQTSLTTEELDRRPFPVLEAGLNLLLNSSYHLVESRERLLLVQRITAFKRVSGCYLSIKTSSFRVLGMPPGVCNLDGDAIFIGSSSGTKSIPAADLQGVEKDCIYFMDDERKQTTSATEDNYNIVGKYSLEKEDTSCCFTGRREEPKTNCQSFVFLSYNK